LDIPSQEVITKDNAVIIANAVAYINLISPEKSVYGVEDYRLVIQNLVQTSLRSIIGEMDLDDALSSRDEIKARCSGKGCFGRDQPASYSKGNRCQTKKSESKGSCRLF
jgi:regulator of protease activity HflC (stomatin/prohibitin superfamily)